MTDKTRHIIHIVLISLGLVLFLGYGLFAILYYGQFKQTPVCKNIRIEIVDSTDYRFVNEYEILQYINKHQKNPTGKTVGVAEADALERSLSKMSLAKNVECYVAYNGDMCIRLWQRCPMFRVLDQNRKYYVDQDRKIMPTSANFTAHLPVVSGQFTEEFLTGELFDFITSLEDDERWNSLLSEVHVDKGEKITLVLRNGVPFILLGSLDNAKEKIERLEAWYKQYPSKNNPQIYSKINLSYEPLIYCTKNHGKAPIHSSH